MTRLEQIKQRAERATAAPWRFSGERLDKMLVGGEVGTLVHGVNAPIIVADPCVVNPQDEPFIAHSRTDLPLLLAVAEAAMKYLDWGFQAGEANNLKVLSDTLKPLRVEVSENA